MRKLLFLLILCPLFISCGSDDDEFTFYTYTEAKLGGENTKGKKIPCSFFFFEPDEYISIVKHPNKSDRAIATKKNGTQVESIAWAYYIAEGSYGVARYVDWSGKYKHPEIIEGTYYVVCFPTTLLGGGNPYKSKVFTKQKDKALVISPVFTSKSYYGVDGYKYFEWDE